MSGLVRWLRDCLLRHGARLRSWSPASRVLRLRSAWVCILAALFITIAPASAFAKSKVDITAVEIPDAISQGKERDAQVRRTIRRLAHASMKHLDFGKQKVELTLVVKELVIEQLGDDLIRVRCTLVGKLKGGGSAKSRLAFSGKPLRKKQLTRQVLTAVTDGVMTRLAELARARAKAHEAKDDAAKAAD